MAALIWASVFPAATAFSISASEMALFEPKAIKSWVKGTPSFWAISFTLSYEALVSSASAALLVAGWAAGAAATGAAGAGLATGAYYYTLCLARTWAITSLTLGLAAGAGLTRSKVLAWAKISSLEAPELSLA